MSHFLTMPIWDILTVDHVRNITVMTERNKELDSKTRSDIEITGGWESHRDQKAMP